MIFDSGKKAYIGPFLVFLAFNFLGQIVKTIGDGYAAWPIAHPSYWIFPIQTVVCAWLLWRCRKSYQFAPIQGWLWAAGVGLLSLVLWIAPWAELMPESLRLKPRTDGFNPDFFGTSGSAYSLNVAMRFLRLVIIVPLVEEIFWRGFLLRYMVCEDFRKVPFGTFRWRSFLASSGLFCFEHQPLDWPAAILTGALFNLVAYRSRSLFACILTHAITNLGLGLWVMQSGQWGFW